MPSQEHPSTDEDQPAMEPQVELAGRTKAQYDRLFKTMIRAAQQRRWDGSEEGQHPPVSDHDLIEDLLANHAGHGHAYLMTMKSAIIHSIKGTATAHLIPYLRSAEFNLQLKAAAAYKESKRKRVIPVADFAKLEKQLQSMRGHAQNALICLQATVASGLRPVEWSHAFWEDRRRGLLRVKNAKNKAVNALNRRSAVPGRQFKEGVQSFRIVNIDPADIDLVDKQVLIVRAAIIKASSGRLPNEIDDNFRYECFKPYFDAVRLSLHRANISAFGTDLSKRYSLYDARSTFAANRRARDGVHAAAKALGHDAEKLDTNVSAHYGNRYSAWASYKRSPTKPDSQPNDIQGLNQTVPVTFNLPKFSK